MTELQMLFHVECVEPLLAGGAEPRDVPREAVLTRLVAEYECPRWPASAMACLGDALAAKASEDACLDWAKYGRVLDDLVPMLEALVREVDNVFRPEHVDGVPERVPSPPPYELVLSPDDDCKCEWKPLRKMPSAMQVLTDAIHTLQKLEQTLSTLRATFVVWRRETLRLQRAMVFMERIPNNGDANNMLTVIGLLTAVLGLEGALLLWTRHLAMASGAVTDRILPKLRTAQYRDDVFGMEEIEERLRTFGVAVRRLENEWWALPSGGSVRSAKRRSRREPGVQQFYRLLSTAPPGDQADGVAAWIRMAISFFHGAEPALVDAPPSRSSGRGLLDDSTGLMLLYNCMRDANIFAAGQTVQDEAVLVKAHRKACRFQIKREEKEAAAARKKAAGPADSHLWGQLVSYELVIKTGDVRGAGTDANIFVVLYGETVDTGELPLYTTHDKFGRDDQFERDCLDVFLVDAPYVGEIFKLRVGHDAQGLCAGWHLEKITVHDCRGRSFFFPCWQWLDNGSDVQRVRELLPRSEIADSQPFFDEETQSPDPHRLTTYDIKVFTGDEVGAGSDANVRVVLYGEFGMSGPWDLNTRFKDNFERGNVDTFSVQAACVGRLHVLQIGHDGAGMGNAWLLEQVVVQDVGCNLLHLFPCHKWLRHNEKNDGAAAEVVLTCATRDDQETQYHIYIYTGDKLGAGTDASVSIRLYGRDGDSGLLPLKACLNHRNKFERTRCDEFLVEVSYVGPLLRCSIEHDGWGIGAGWYLERVMVKDTINLEEYHFPCQQWLDSGTGDHQIMRDLIMRQRGGKQRLVPRVGRGSARHLSEYKVLVLTGTVNGAGTDANVKVGLYGAEGHSGPWILNDRLRDNFEQGSMDTFDLQAAWLGELQSIKIGHDGKWSNSAWFLDSVFVRDELNGGEWQFDCKDWLDRTLSDGKQWRMLPGRRVNFSQEKEWLAASNRQSVDAWLAQLNLSEYSLTFAKHDLEPREFPALTDATLKGLGVNLAARGRILAKISVAPPIAMQLEETVGAR